MKKLMTISLLMKDVDGVLKVCLGKKKRGFRVGKFNGYGGKVEESDVNILSSASREINEEARVKAKLTYKGIVTFVQEGREDYECHIFTSNSFVGDPVETEEMSPYWFDLNSLPYHYMGVADPIWIPKVLQGNTIIANFYYTKDDFMYDYTLEKVVSG